MKIYDKKSNPRMLNFGLFSIGTMCGSRWYWRRSWSDYPLVWTLGNWKGFGIGPILF